VRSPLDKLAHFSCQRW